MKITDEMVAAATGAIVLGEDARGNPVRLSPQEARLVLTTALAVQTQQGVEVKDWHRSDNAYGGVMLYSLREDGWRKGEPVMVNDVTIRIERAPGSETDIEPIVQRVLSALVDVPAVESEPVAWLRSCRISFLSGEERDGHIVTDRNHQNAFPVYAHPPRSLSNEEEIADAARAYVDAVNGGLGNDASDDEWHTYDEVKQQAFDALRAALSTRKGSAGDGAATGTKGASDV